MSTVAFSVDFSASDPPTEGDDVLMSGVLFRSGEYKDKSFTLTPAELHAALSRFAAAAPLDLEHKPLQLHGHDLRGAFGTVEDVWTDDGGQTAYATIRKPAWLHEIMPENRVSATWDRSTKDLIGAAWTATPRVSDAEMVAQFSAAVGQTPSYDYSSTHLTLPPALAMKVRAVAATIPDAHLAEDGRENDPHVTALYGLHTSDPADVAPHIAGRGPIPVRLGALKQFASAHTGKPYDVLMAPVESPALHAPHDTLADNLEHTATHPVYRPHVTLAYLKPGMGKFYTGDTALEGEHALVHHLTFGAKDGTKTRLPLRGGGLGWLAPGGMGAPVTPPDTDGPDGDNDADDQPQTVGMSDRTPTVRPRGGTKGRPMKMFDWILGKAQEEGVDIEDTHALEAQFSTIDDTAEEVAALKAQHERDRATLVALQAERDAARQQAEQTAAATFAESQVRAHKALPAETPAIIKAYLRAVANDQYATFSDGEESNLALLEAQFSSRPAHLLAESTLPEGAVALVAPATTEGMPGVTGGKMTPERRAQLLGSAPMGQAILDARTREGKRTRSAGNRPA